MPLYKFQQNDIFHNRIEAYPQTSFFFYSGSAYYNNRPALGGTFLANTLGVSPGHISLYELNVDRVSGSTTAPDIIYPFVVKGGSNDRFSTVTVTTLDERNIDYSEVALPGERLTGSYPMSASISKDYLGHNHVSKALTDMQAAVDARTNTQTTPDRA